jgi:hypothetical protein
MMNMKRGVYGTDDVPWEVQDGRNVAEEEAYRLHKEEIDARDRLAAKRDLLARHEDDSAVYQAADNALYIAFERNGNLYVYARIDLPRKLVRFLPLQVASEWLAKWSPLSQLGDVRSWNMTAPKGCI